MDLYLTFVIVISWIRADTWMKLLPWFFPSKCFQFWITCTLQTSYMVTSSQTISFSWESKQISHKNSHQAIWITANFSPIYFRLSYGNNEIVIKLIDYGQSIDLNFFPPNQIFTSTLNTENFVCTEMLENRPWKYQIDLFCLASTMYSLVCGKYMKIKKQPDSKIRPYVLSEDLAPYLNVQLWELVLYSLINVRDHSTLPDLQKLRLRIREAIVDNEHTVQDKIAKFNAVLDPNTTYP